MKWNCELIQDLLPLYAEGLCSPASRAAVEEHLDECAVCRRLTTPLPVEAPAEPENADRAVKKSIRKVRRRWLSSLVAAVLVVPLLLMSWAQFRGRGVCFTNLDDIFAARRFLTALERQDWEKAAVMHDYSDDYQSILDALAMSVSDWGKSFTSFDLAGHPYQASSYLSREGELPETVEELYGFLYNRQGNAMIPLELWDEIIAVDPGAVYENGWQCWLGEELFGKISTPWGEFMATDCRGFDTAYEYCTYFDLVPTVIYEEAKADLEAEARRVYDSTHADYGYVADMTEEAFLDYMARSYAEDLASLEELVSFDCTGYQGAELLWENDGWHIEFGVQLTYQNKSLDTTMGIGVEDGKVRIVSISHREGVDWLDQLERVLYPSAHPDY